MFGFNKKKEADKQFNLALENLFQYWGNDLPVINSDAYDYINRIWRNIPVVYEATNIIYKKVVKSPLVFYRVKNGKSYKAYKQLDRKDTPQALLLKSQSFEEVSDPALERLLDQPNPQQDWNNFIGVWVLSYLLTGNAYVWRNLAKTTGKPIELWCFPELFINSGGTYNPVKSYSQFYNTDSVINYPAKEIYHSKTPNPNFTIMGDQLYGVSPLRAFLEPLRTIEEANSQSSKQMKNGGVLALLSPTRAEDQMSSDQRKGFMDKFKEALRSQQSFNRFMTSSIAMDVQQVGLPSSDLDLLAIKSANEESIYRLYGIPLARYSQKSSTQNNQAESNKQLIYDAVSPLTDLIGEMLTKFVGTYYKDIVIELDVMQLPEMAVNMKEVAEYIIPLVKSGILNRDEARFAFKYGETKLDYMLDYWIDDKPMSKIYDGTIQPSTGSENKRGD